MRGQWSAVELPVHLGAGAIQLLAIHSCSCCCTSGPTSDCPGRAEVGRTCILVGIVTKSQVAIHFRACKYPGVLRIRAGDQSTCGHQRKLLLKLYICPAISLPQRHALPTPGNVTAKLLHLGSGHPNLGC